MGNQIKTFVLLTALALMVMFFGAALGGRVGLFMGLILALGMNLGSYWFSDKLVLRMYRAEELSESRAPGLFRMVRELAEQAEIPMPRVYLIPDDAANAFATGRSPSHAAVAVTRGIVNLLSPEEIKGVLAHEMGHVKNRDILIQTVAGIMASAIMFLASMARFSALFGLGGEDRPHPAAALLLALVAPLAAMLVQMAISRSREYLADRTGATLSGSPLALASALEKIHAHAARAPMRMGSEATAHLFIANPFSASRLAGLFSTHPPMEERVARLRRMAGSRQP